MVNLVNEVCGGTKNVQELVVTYCIAWNFRQEKISPNLSQHYCAKFSPILFSCTPCIFCLEEFQPFVNVVLLLWGGGRRRVWRERVLHSCMAITYILMCGTFPLAKNLSSCNDHVCLFNRRQWQQWRKRSSSIWELCISSWLNCHLVQQSHGSKSHFTSTTFTEHMCIVLQLTGLI